jgi:hypothetical protein
VLGAIGEVPSYLIDDRRLLDLGLSLVTAYVAYYLYLAYEEGIIRKVRRGEQRHGLGGVLDDLAGAASYVPGVLAAHLGRMGVRFPVVRAGHAPGGLRHLAGPLQHREELVGC